MCVCVRARVIGNVLRTALSLSVHQLPDDRVHKTRPSRAVRGSARSAALGIRQPGALEHDRHTALHTGQQPASQLM